MLTGEIRNKVDRIWETFWTGGIIDYIVANGMIEDNSILMEEPFRSVGSITTLFKDNIAEARAIMSIVELINKNIEFTA